MVVMNLTRKAILAVFAVSLLFTVPICSDQSDADAGPVTTIYDSLTPVQKSGYNALHTAVQNHTSTGDLSYMSIPDGQAVRDAYRYDHPEVFWFDYNYQLMVYPTTTSGFQHTDTITQSQISFMKLQIDAVVSSIVIEEGDRDCKKLRAIHDWLCDKIVYDGDAEHAHDLYGAIVDHRCVCDGYAAAFTYICRLYGFPCVTLTGYTYQSTSVGHAWNLVYGEGDWYFVDATWDDREGKRSSDTYFMVGSNTKISGRTFATEDHMADSLYGISPASEKFRDPDEILRNRIIIGAAAIIIVAYIVLRIRKKRKLLAMYAEVPYEVTDQPYEGTNCPYCGAVLDRELDFCAACGGMLRKEEERTEEDQ